MTSLAIRSEGISKRYRLGARQESYRTLRESLSQAALHPFQRLAISARHFFAKQQTIEGESEDSQLTRSKANRDFWALKDVSFEVQRGDVVGIIGRNGAGKSTLLKILSRITEPTKGRVALRGRVASLLEVGTGFHPELTGRENIYLNGSILGMTRREIEKKFDEIVDFAEVNEFLDTPVKRFSSGMYVRLAFAVAANLEPEILFVDEVLAVGDQQFQKKCLGKLEDVSRHGRTIIFVSHDMAAVHRLTTRCLYLRQGRTVCFEPTRTAISNYLCDSSKVTDGEIDVSEFRRGACRDSTVRITRFRITDGNGKLIRVVNSGEPFVVEVTYSGRESLPDGCLAFWMVNELGQRVATFFSLDQNAHIPLRPGTWTVKCEVRGLPLAPGKYAITLGINQQANTTAFDVLVDVPALEIALPAVESGELEWTHRPWGAIHWRDVTWTNTTRGE